MSAGGSVRLIFSRDRAAQLDLLLRSMQAFLPDEQTNVIWTASTPRLWEGYESMGFADEQEDFQTDLMNCLVECQQETVTFFCDDDVLFRHPGEWPAQVLEEDDQVLCYSLRLGRGNAQMPLPEDFPRWLWKPLPRTDFGFPGSIDGHTFRVKDVLRMIGSSPVPDPTMLETVLALRVEILATQRPLMASSIEQCLVGVPVNRVSPSSGVRFGQLFPCSTEEANERFLAGERISLDSINPDLVDACHREFEFIWEPRS